MLVLLAVIVNGAGTPVPVRLAVCVLPVTSPLLSVTVRVALSLLTVDGVNVTLMVHEPPTASGLLLLGQLSVSPKSAALGPLIAMAAEFARVRGAVPTLVKVTPCAVLSVP